MATGETELPITVPDVMADEGGRRVLNAPVSEAAYAGWMEYAATCGASFTAIMEVIGRKLALGENVDLTHDGIAQEARQLDYERRRRPK